MGCEQLTAGRDSFPAMAGPLRPYFHDATALLLQLESPSPVTKAEARVFFRQYFQAYVSSRACAAIPCVTRRRCGFAACWTDGTSLAASSSTSI
jgi:hypothetical protein